MKRDKTKNKYTLANIAICFNRAIYEYDKTIQYDRVSYTIPLLPFIVLEVLVIIINEDDIPF